MADPAAGRGRTPAAIVTGVSRGLGEALAADLLRRGFDVVGLGRGSSPKLAGARFRFVESDLAHPARIAAALVPALRELAARRPASVTLINNAAVAGPVGLIGRLDAAEVEAAIATNIAAPLVVADLFLRTFADDAVPRRVINISSGAAQRALAGSGAYSMAKAAIEMLTLSLAADHAAPNFRAIALRPGIFETAMQQFMRSRDPAEFPSVELFRGFKAQRLLKDPADVAARIVAKLVLEPVDHGRVYVHTDLD
ncbi:MAG: SDR family NAD(P)-dependent oxidoreductase [Betaproteobacteria bacterium]